MSNVVVDDRPGSGSDRRSGSVPHLGWIVAGASAAAGVIHLAMAPAHAGSGLTDPLGFAVVGWFQLAVAAVILLGRDDRRLYQVAILGNLAIIGLWVWSRTAGLPVGSHAGEAEAVGAVDLTTVGLQTVAILVAARILLSAERPSIGRVAPAMAAVAALGLATVVLASPDTASHGGGGGHSHGEETAGDDHHATGEDHSTLMAQIDAERCDRGFNIDAYWDDAAYLGIDTYFGGAMSSDDHSHSVAEQVAEPDPTGGRGSVGLDVLVQYTSKAGGGELAAAQMVAQLGDADEDAYQAWRWWLRNKLNGGGDHGHGDSAEGGAHDSHVGPQAWVAMTDQEECDTLAAELERARAVALQYPTAGDAMDAGWVYVAPYLSGIASHFMRFEYVDGEFDVDEPEMILYDGNGRDARVVGLSYYIHHDGTDAPTQGFTGANDHFHRHIGLCQGAGGIIGDSTTTAEECEAMGGRKSDGSRGWMNHVWIVPGCESPWGVFSAASPLLEGQLGDASGTNDGACVASGVRERYGLDDVAEAGDVQRLTGDAAADSESDPGD